MVCWLCLLCKVEPRLQFYYLVGRTKMKYLKQVKLELMSMYHFIKKIVVVV
jgi:hypothetical protein